MGEDMRMDAGGRRGGRGAGVEGSGVKHCEGQWPRGKTEPNMQLSLFLLQIVKIEKRQPTKDNCTFGFVFTSNVVLELEPKVSNYRNVALVMSLGCEPRTIDAAAASPLVVSCQDHHCKWSDFLSSPGSLNK